MCTRGYTHQKLAELNRLLPSLIGQGHSQAVAAQYLLNGSGTTTSENKNTTLTIHYLQVETPKNTQTHRNGDEGGAAFKAGAEAED